jgi:hypothetical protein
MVEVPAARRVVVPVECRAVLATVIDGYARICRGQVDLLVALRRRRLISQEVYTGLLARSDQLLAAITELGSVTAHLLSPAGCKGPGPSRRVPAGS